MKKSEFEKLKVGDLVQLRTLDEIKQLRCYDKIYGEIVDDDGHFSTGIIRRYPLLLGKTYTIEKIGESGIYIADEHNVANSFFPVFYVVRQYLKGRE